VSCFLSEKACIISDKTRDGHGKTRSINDSQILSRIAAAVPDTVFTPRRFLDVGSRDALDKALSRNRRAGTLGKLARGLYDVPPNPSPFWASGFPNRCRCGLFF
jgi:hypothetical protein